MGKHITLGIMLAICLMSFCAIALADSELWVATYAAPGNFDDLANAIATDSAGNVYVTGQFGANSGHADYGTIKYDSSGNQVWVQRYGGTGSEAVAIAVDCAGNAYVTGYSIGSDGNRDYATIKYDGSGNLLWVRSYSGPGHSDDSASAIAVDSSGNVYVTGSSYIFGGGTYGDYATIKYDSGGNQLWVQRYNGPGNSDDSASAIAVDSSGNVYVTGGSIGIGRDNDYATVKYDSSGCQVWVERYNGPSNGEDFADAIALDSSGNACVTGYSAGGDGSGDYATIKYDSGGNQVWVQRYNGPANSDDSPSRVAIDSSGSVYVTGSSHGSDGYHYATIKYDPSGSQLWLQRYSGSIGSTDRANTMTVDSAGNVYVTGQFEASSNSTDYGTIKYDTSGNQLWVQRYSGLGNSDDSPSAVAVDSSGNIYVTGSSYGGCETGWDCATIKYDSRGNQLWAQRYNGPANSDDYASAIAVDSSGNAYVTGSSYEGSGTRCDFVTAKYDSSGNQVWAQRYDGLGNDDDHAKSIVVDSAGNVYVTGYSRGSGTALDYATIKYDSSGSQLWVQRYNGPSNGDDYAYAIATDSSGNVYVTGSRATIKYDPGGNCLWLQEYNFTAKAIAVDSAANVYVTGSGYGGSGTGYDYVTIKYDPGGHQAWVRRYNGPGNGYDGANAIAVDSAGGIYVTGVSHDGSGGAYDDDYATIKYDSNGNEVWVRRYNGPYDYSDGATAIALDSSGSVYVTGSSYGSDGYHYATIKYDPTGNQLWLQRYSGPVDSTDQATAIAVDSACNVYVTGQFGENSDQAARGTIKYDSNGNLLWVQRRSGGCAYAIAVDSVGNAYVTGYEYRSVTGLDYATVKYDGAPPAGNVIINGGAGFTVGTGVTLSLAATDNATGVAQMRLSNDGTNWSDWENYSTSKAWTLSGPDGLKTVYAQFKDGMGNPSASVTSTITLDATLPVITSVAATPALNAAGDTVHVVVRAAGLAGVASVTADGATLTKTGSDSWSGDLAAASGVGVHAVTVTALNNLSHTATDTSGSYTTTTILGTTMNSLAASLMASASNHWLFRVWGKVTIIDTSRFYLDDGSQTQIKVVAPGYTGLADGDYASARGILDTTSTPPTLTCSAVTVVNYK